MNAKHLLTVLAALSATSCSPTKIDVSTRKLNGQLQASLSQDRGLLFGGKRVPCVREAGLYLPGTYGRNAATWLIEASGNVQCIDLAAFTVGITPKRFNQIVPLRAKPGEIYALRVEGIGVGQAIVTF